MQHYVEKNKYVQIEPEKAKLGNHILLTGKKLLGLLAFQNQHTARSFISHTLKSDNTTSAVHQDN